MPGTNATLEVEWSILLAACSEIPARKRLDSSALCYANRFAGDFFSISLLAMAFNRFSIRRWLRASSAPG